VMTCRKADQDRHDAGVRALLAEMAGIFGPENIRHEHMTTGVFIDGPGKYTKGMSGSVYVEGANRLKFEVATTAEVGRKLAEAIVAIQSWTR
jgi:hypothetical protein